MSNEGANTDGRGDDHGGDEHDRRPRPPDPRRRGPPAADRAAPAGGCQPLYVANRAAGVLTVVDTATHAVRGTIPIDTPQARAAGGYAAFTRTVRWIDGDWRMQVPTAPARLIASVATYHPLGAPRV